MEVETESGIVGLGEVDAWPTGDQAVISMINGKFRSLLLGRRGPGRPQAVGQDVQAFHISHGPHQGA